MLEEDGIGVAEAPAPEEAPNHAVVQPTPAPGPAASTSSRRGSRSSLGSICVGGGKSYAAVAAAPVPTVESDSAPVDRRTSGASGSSGARRPSVPSAPSNSEPAPVALAPAAAGSRRGSVAGPTSVSALPSSSASTRPAAAAAPASSSAAASSSSSGSPSAVPPLPASPALIPPAGIFGGSGSAGGKGSSSAAAGTGVGASTAVAASLSADKPRVFGFADVVAAPPPTAAVASRAQQPLYRPAQHGAPFKLSDALGGWVFLPWVLVFAIYLALQVRAHVLVCGRSFAVDALTIANALPPSTDTDRSPPTCDCVSLPLIPSVPACLHHRLCSCWGCTGSGGARTTRRTPTGR